MSIEVTSLWDAALQSKNFRGRHSAVTKNAKLGKQGYFSVLAGSRLTWDAVNKGPLVFTEFNVGRG